MKNECEQCDQEIKVQNIWGITKKRSIYLRNVTKSILLFIPELNVSPYYKLEQQDEERMWSKSEGP